MPSRKSISEPRRRSTSGTAGLGLNKNGVINLRNGKMRRSKPGDYITKITAVSPEGDCPRFEKILDEITDGNCALQGFLQRMAGYALTGVTRDHALFFLYGLGANGKSVFLNTLVGILGDYHRVAPTEMLLASKFDRHPTELAGLVGRRLATAVETGRVSHWAEEKIKAMTGGDKITRRASCTTIFSISSRRSS